MSLLWRTEAWKDALQFLFLKGFGIIIFLRACGWLNEIFLTLMNQPVVHRLKYS